MKKLLMLVLFVSGCAADVAGPEVEETEQASQIQEQWSWMQHNFDEAVANNDAANLLLKCFVEKNSCNHDDPDPTHCNDQYVCTGYFNSSKCCSQRYPGTCYTATNDLLTATVRNGKGNRVMWGTWSPDQHTGQPRPDWLQTTHYTGQTGTCFAFIPQTQILQAVYVEVH